MSESGVIPRPEDRVTGSDIGTIHVGEMHDADGHSLIFTADREDVVIGIVTEQGEDAEFRLTPAIQDDFARLLFRTMAGAEDWQEMYATEAIMPP